MRRRFGLCGALPRKTRGRPGKSGGQGLSHQRYWRRQFKPTHCNGWALPSEAPVMPNDAKLGMVAGVALVIAVAVFFGHKDAATSAAARSASARAAERPGQPPSGQPESPPQPPAGEEKA